MTIMNGEAFLANEIKEGPMNVVWITKEAPSGSGFKKVKRIDQINKDIVYGYIKEAQMLLPSQTIIIHIIPSIN